MINYQALKVIVIGFVTFVAFDLLWFGFLMRDFYVKQLGGKLRMANGAMAPHWPSALAVWLLLVVGLYVFVLARVISLFQAAVCGALYGFIVYGVYDLTNYAMLTGWPIKVVIVDILWGVVINGLVSIVMFSIGKYFC